MSWQGYVDTSLVGSGHLDHGALCSSAGDSVWAHSAGFEVKLTELKIIADILKGNKAAKDKAYADGLHVAGTRYVLAKAEERSLYARHGKDGIVIAISGQAIIIGHHNANHQAGNATLTVEGLADYLTKSGY